MMEKNGNNFTDRCSYDFATVHQSDITTFSSNLLLELTSSTTELTFNAVVPICISFHVSSYNNPSFFLLITATVQVIHNVIRSATFGWKNNGTHIVKWEVALARSILIVIRYF